LYFTKCFFQDGKFTFTLPSTLNTSAGVFKDDSILIKTLWNNVSYNAGTYTKSWDGTDDFGNAIKSPDASYKIKVLSNNVQYTWQGSIGNSSDAMTGENEA
jgi:flagellar hook assembly protein FlgD